MKKHIFFGISIIVLGLLIAIGPHTIFRVCVPEDETMLMSCNYTAIAESIVGGIAVLLGLLYILIPQKKVRLAFSILTAISSILAFLFPTLIIGVCGGIHMHCHAVALPSLVIISLVLFVVSIADIIYVFVKRRRSDEKRFAYN